MNDWHKDHKKAIAEKWRQCPKTIARTEELRDKWATGRLGINALCRAHAHAERELAEARAEIGRLNKNMRFAAAINLAMQEAGQDLPDLRGHECLAKHKLLSLFDLWRKKVRPRLPGFIDDEISRRDALIEQMREALNVLVASATPSGPLWHGSAEMQIARAALEAAKRGDDYEIQKKADCD